MVKVGECYLPSIVRRQYFSIIFCEKSVHYTIKYGSKKPIAQKSLGKRINKHTWDP
jgi:hypothetical protein